MKTLWWHHTRLAPLSVTVAMMLSGALSPGQTLDPSPPAQPVKLIFIHHSTGEAWLSDGSGQLGLALRNNNYFVSDTNYGWGPADPAQGGTIGDHTDIPHWYSWFTGPSRETYMAALYAESGQHSSYTRLPTDPGGPNTIVMFKSCFPNSDLSGNPTDPPALSANNNSSLTVANAKRIYLDLLPYFASRQDKLFIVIAAPPLRQVDTSGAAAGNARAFNNWLVNDWLTGYSYRNVAVFDFFTVLTSNGGDASANDLGWTGGNHHRYSAGSIQHVTDQATNYLAYPTADSHPSQAGNLKATGEFVSLLNVFYHRFLGSGTPAPSPSTPPGAFKKNSPGHGEQLASRTASLTWQSSAGAETYEYCYDAIDNGVCDSGWTSTGSTAATTVGGLARGATYYWQARARNAVGTVDGDGGSWWSFTTADWDRPYDYTGDGKADILWRHATRGDVWLWPMDGTRRTAETPVRVVADANWEIRGTGDQTGDGTPDILWRNKTSGALCLWPMRGSALLSERYVATVNPAYDVVETGDYNGDGKSDILWRHTANGDVWMWLMDGPTRLAEVRVGSVNPAFVVKGSGDLNGDHKADIVWCRRGTGAEVWVWLMDGPTRLAEAWVATVPNTLYDIVAVADYTGDGKADVLWRHATRGDVWLWPMNGVTRLAETPVRTVQDTNYRIVGHGDYNGDGKADILWHHSTRGEVWVWLMDGARLLSEAWVATVPDVGYQIVPARRKTESFPFTLPEGSGDSVTLGPVQAGVGQFEVVLDYPGAYRILACVGTATACKVFGGAPMRAVYDIPGDFPSGPIQVQVYFNGSYTQPPGTAAGTVSVTYNSR